MAEEHARIDEQSSQFVSAASLRVRLDWFNKLRWGAVGCVLLGTLLADRIIGSALPRTPLLWMTAGLAALNLLYTVRNLRVPPRDIGVEIRHVKMQMVGDLVVLTVLLNLSGGIENPLLYVYIVHVVIASLLFKGREIFQIAWLAIFLFTAAVAAEYFEILPHHHLLSASAMTHEAPFILLTLASFWLVLLISAYIGALIMRHNRAIKNELVVRQRALVAADQAKMDFFRFVTHEIKSPVSTAQSAVETALELGGAGMQVSVEDMLSRAVGRLEHAGEMVRDLADFTRGEDLAREQRGPVDVNRLITRIAGNLAESAARRGIRIELDLPDPALVRVGSAGMYEKIIQNLVSNAVRYNRDRGLVSVTLQPAGAGLRLVVADEGIGITPGDRERIFEEFYRTPQAQEMTNLGTGLGLAIVRKFVTQLGGRITLASTPGEGSTFTVEIPGRKPGPAGREGRAETSAPAGAAREDV